MLFIVEISDYFNLYSIHYMNKIISHSRHFFSLFKSNVYSYRHTAMNPSSDHLFTPPSVHKAKLSYHNPTPTPPHNSPTESPFSPNQSMSPPTSILVSLLMWVAEMKPLRPVVPVYHLKTRISRQQSTQVRQ